MQFKPGSMSLAAVANRLNLDDSTLLANLQAVQRRNRIAPDEELRVIEGEIATEEGVASVRFPNFSCEMETGTGKTYVYIRTALELFKRYGLRKYIIVVPSVAVREGVLKTLKITSLISVALRQHHLSLLLLRLGDVDIASSVCAFRFDRDHGDDARCLQQVEEDILIRRSTERLQGVDAPVHLLQETCPVLILDEPQNMESLNSISALCTLNPLLTLRYSATHKNPYNITYRLTPATAYDMGLVKKIEVHSVLQDGEMDTPYIKVLDISSGKRASAVKAKIVIHKLQSDGRVKESALTVKPGDSLSEKANRPDYSGRKSGNQFRRALRAFGNESELRIGEEQGSDRGAIFLAQITHTIEEHFRKQRRLRDSGIKVASLFFIDKVANYIGEDGRPGLITEMFDRAFEDARKRFPEWSHLAPDRVRAARILRRSAEEAAMLKCWIPQATQRKNLPPTTSSCATRKIFSLFQRRMTTRNFAVSAMCVSSFHTRPYVRVGIIRTSSKSVRSIRRAPKAGRDKRWDVACGSASIRLAIAYAMSA